MDLPRRPRSVILKADPFAQLKLLDVQALDTKVDTLAHQVRGLPEHAAIASATARANALNDRERDLRVAVSDLTDTQEKAEKDVETVRARRERDRGRMDAGQISDPKALTSMQHELESLERRISSLEDAELEVMEQLESAQAELDQVSRERREALDEAAAAAQARDQRTAELGAESADVVAERTKTVEGIPADLLALYDRLRESKGGVGAAELRARQCGGCMLTLDAAVLADIKARPSDEVVRCEECGRILVRTGESGL